MSKTNPFRCIPVNAEEQYRLRLMGLIIAIFEREREQGRLNQYLDQFSFLQSYAERIESLWRETDFPSQSAWNAALSKWQRRKKFPLDRLEHWVPGPVGAAAMLLIASIEEDPRLSLLIEPDGGPPTLGGITVFLSDLFPQLDTGTIRAAIAELVSIGALVMGGLEAPRIEWTLRASSAAFELLSGAPCRREYFSWCAHSQLISAKQWIAPSPTADTPKDLAALLCDAAATTTLLRGDCHNGRKTMVRMAAQRAGLGIVHLCENGLADQAVWQEACLVAALADAVLLLECALGPAEQLVIPQAGLTVPHLAIVTSRRASINSDRPTSIFIAIDLPRPDPEARAKHWRRAGWSRDARRLSERLLTSGHIHRLSSGAQRSNRTESQAAIKSSLATIRDPRLETTAQLIEPEASLNALVLGEAGQEELRMLVLRCRLREKLHGSSDVGVKALLTGPSGTGKTLAAKHLAHELDRPLYRIDLAATVNKFIGETEKNLEKVLAAAEELDIVLLLDEGDALLGKRTEISSANDRYANLETNFLLQRLEDFRGIIFVTTNDGERIDRAFRRRMDAIITFRMPDQISRLDILSRQLGTHEASLSLLDDIACRCDFSGGQIDNLVTHARLLALAEGSPIADQHLFKAVEREYHKTGDHCPLRPVLLKAS